MIPKIIHYCWFSKDKNKELPKAVQRSIKSWKSILPEYEIRLWNEETFDINSIPWVKECYECGEASYAFLADYVRLYALYNYGGIYLDADVEVLKSLDSILNNEVVFGLENKNSVGTAVIGAVPHNSLIKELLDYYHNLHYLTPNNDLNREQNNFIINRILEKKIGGALVPAMYSKVTILPKEVLYPHNESYITDKSLTIHHCIVSWYKRVSVVMPVFNGEKYLKESIDSILNQTFTEFELIIVNDGSIDDTENIIKSYNDSRIIYVKTAHLGISNALNTGIRRSSGLYIARMDADDIMYLDRLEYQYNWMEQHKDIDIMGGGMQFINNSKEQEFFTPKEDFIELEAMLKGNLVAHPTVMLRKSSLYRIPFLYEDLYNGAEDYKLWLTSLSYGLKIYNTSKPLIQYRVHDSQSSLSDVSSRNAYLIRKAYSTKSKEDTELTIIIPFLNEGNEVEKTVMSIRATTDGVKIILIDDASTDNYPYKKISDIFDCTFYRNEENLGVAGSRDLGVSKCTTPYFTLLDGHMRFYHMNWDNMLIASLKNNPSSILCSNTICIFKDKYGNYINEDGKDGLDRMVAAGAFVNMEPGYEFSSKWTNKILSSDAEDILVPIACALGAVYSCSVEWWNHIGGLQGLVKYGLDEPLMSIKTFMAGGSTLLVKDWGVGHLYRNQGNYHVPSKCLNHNHLYLANLFADSEEQLEKWKTNYRNNVGEEALHQAEDMFNANIEEFKKFKEYFYSNVVKRSFNDFLQLNDLVKCE